MTGMEIICETCSQTINFNQKARHRRDCSPEDHSEIAVVPADGTASKPTNKFGEEHEKREHPWCDLCEQSIYKNQLKYHKGRCQEGEPSDIAVVPPEGEDTAPVCVFCEMRVEPESFNEHSRECAVSSHGSDLGV